MCIIGLESGVLLHGFNFLISEPKHVGTQKNSLNEMVLMSTQNLCKN